jgi:phage shock protein PspC (stress-responsive transcriptional regulator)
MNKVIAIHLHGTAFQLEEGGYEKLRNYLDNAARQLDGNPDKAEILADIEQAIADKFVARLTAGRNVVMTSEVEAVIAEVGPVANGSDPTTDEKTGTVPEPQKTDIPHTEPRRRLYRIKEGGMISGVCNGLAAYIGIDVTLLRLAVAVLIFFSFGTVAIAYVVAIIIIPKAETPEQKAAATGPSQTAHDFVRMAREGYYEGMKSFPDRQARREWKRKFKRDMRDWKRNFSWQMKENFGAWKHRWEPSSPTCPPPTSSFFVLPILATLKAILVLVFTFAILSLIASGSVFGVSLPGGLPVWIGVILLFLVYQVVVAPIKALRYAYYCQSQGRPYFWHPFAELWHGLVTLFVIAVGVWAADRFMPGFHQALLALPDFLRNAGSNVQQWWAGQ